MSSAAERAQVLDACCEPLRSALYQPLAAAMEQDGFVVAQLGQSLDGRIATEDGHSHYINGPESLDHLHRLRAWPRPCLRADVADVRGTARLQL